MVVVSVGVDCVAVQLAPPFQESSRHIFGAPFVPSTRASRRTSMPSTPAPAGTPRPKLEKRCRSRAVLVHAVVEAVPPLLSTAFSASSASALTAPTSKPLPSPPVSAACAVAPRKPARFGVTESVALLFTPPAEPPIVTFTVLPTACVVTGKVAVVAPAATVTLAGTLATDELLLESVTTVPPGGAAEVSVAVPVEGAPPTTLGGFSD